MAARGALLEARRRLRPVARGVRAFLSRIAPPATRGLLRIASVGVGILTGILELATRSLSWLGSRLGPLASGLGVQVYTRVTPVGTMAVVTGAAAVALGASQFLDYHGVAVGAPLYEGEVGTTAPVPLTDLETAGSAHLYALIPAAVAALVLIALTAAGRWRLGRIVGLVGLLGLVVSAAVDAPQGLDAGTAGTAFAGAEARLLEGFWIQVVASAVLLVGGPLLGSYVRASRGVGRRRRTAADGGAERPPPATEPAPPWWEARA